MIRLAANLDYLFRERPFMERFEAAARAGFGAVELLFPYDVPIAQLRQQLQAHELELVLLNCLPGDTAAGELGLAVLPGRQADAARIFGTALEYAVELGCPTIHFLAGKPPPQVDRRSADQVFLENLRAAADRAQPHGIQLTLEPLNAGDRAGYHIERNEHAIALIDASGRDNVQLQLDLYHCRITHGDVAGEVERYRGRIGHVQIAGVPQRVEPQYGEVDHAAVLERLDADGYEGFIGCEYNPRGETLAGLSWATPYLNQALRGAR